MAAPMRGLFHTNCYLSQQVRMLSMTGYLQVKTTGRLGVHSKEQFEYWRDHHGKRKVRPHAITQGPLVDQPDWSFADGRPAPLTDTMIQKKLEQKELAKKIVQYVKEIDFAVENHERRIRRQNTETDKMLNKYKLRTKGKNRV